MTLSQRYRIKTPEVVYDIIDDEVIIINFDSGNYYSLQSTAAIIWRLILYGISVHAIISIIMQHYQGNRYHIEQSIYAFFTQLLEHQLITPVQDVTIDTDVLLATSSSLSSITPPTAETPTTPQVVGTFFEPPILEMFTDMQQLLLFESMSEGDDMIWIKVKTA